ncbi:nitrile hydratase accessory protein [Agrobacterium sp. T29]|uniref:nitrile hydratase accessory protein n=1 Tax=Agrobacterium sp. T29 TaxID=2580515 RepID=UPI00143D177D|nr:nitrile hydratase accessory protein [Agrobacterium sp. T29]
MENMEPKISCGIEPPVWDEGTGMVFAEPWQGQIFAMTIALNEAGKFNWSDWVAVFSRHRKTSASTGLPDTVMTYYDDWLNALEEITDTLALVTHDECRIYKHAWEHATHRTPHGKPIILEDRDFQATRSKTQEEVG